MPCTCIRWCHLHPKCLLHVYWLNDFLFIVTFHYLFNAMVVCLEWPLRGHHLQRGRCSRGCALCRAKGGGNRWSWLEPFTLPSLGRGQKPELPGMTAATQAWLQTRASLYSQGHGQYPVPPGLEMLASNPWPLPARGLTVEQSCGHVPITEPGHCRDLTRCSCGWGSTVMPASPLPRLPLETASEAKTLSTN